MFDQLLLAHHFSGVTHQVFQDSKFLLRETQALFLLPGYATGKGQFQIPYLEYLAPCPEITPEQKP